MFVLTGLQSLIQASCTKGVQAFKIIRNYLFNTKLKLAQAYTWKRHYASFSNK